MAEPQLAVIVLAAGQGTRMRSRTPKVLHRIGGRSLLEHVLVTAESLAPDRTVVVVRHERDLVAGAVTDAAPRAVVVDQDDVPGTGRAVEMALAELAGFTGDVLVLSGDVPLLDAVTLGDLLAAHRRDGVAATLLSARPDDPTGYGRVVREGDGTVARVVEQKDASRDEAAIAEINAGVYVFQAGPLREHLALVGTANAQGERYLTDVVALLRASRLAVAAASAPDASAALGVNDRVQLSDAAAALNARTVRHWQREGVTVLDPATTWIDVTATLAPDVTVLPNTHILRATAIAEGATVGPDTSLVDCEVGADAVVTRTDATLAVIGAGATVGPFAYLRPGTDLGAQGKIGTFVETKNARIGEASKIPHLSYVGDAEVGVGANVGAGTIVANYDGERKHRTRVGDHVRTGAHNVFVAPVRIGDGAYTGAGTVVRKNVPPGALAVVPGSQRNVEGWVETHRPGSAAAQAAEKAAHGSQEEDG
ncbi:bifunctional UDP-N-acetylglucosamine diphosphorylase/glucosamine-1-phosphate N-acetyltransferase GlmU [Microbacterium sp. LRZ72]|uniref:bifunctional UDP-N-acetylglucosamine diphosphorylase/glucosamine-1-phosphate N-acetyltransferase GlmU n=1 Tax=Microbacterium sp. LRZ72 TaxID=2942481 RepID=UPI0029B5F584|nr:bifunctional UDP-N-acetylglucosamine diphosphorylase/glucosamine-1-phosphate N-acetyltransferase GlmU [Microbacterium sp. LRZ72]MDX2375844.1 bifunctional UDP-N-acetylglucosamine diphosphorylase/glucosamine-1-phosphate N-acetyltransferase GlmU [Microbacterium sp. LRZ72]